MDRNNDRTLTFTRRALMVGAAQAALLVVLGGRLAWLQVTQGQRYRMLAENNRINVKMLAPARGLIFDRNGERLAVNGQNFRVTLIPEQTSDIKKSLDGLKKMIQITDHDIERTLRLAKRQPSYMPIDVKENLDWEQVAKVEVNLPDLPGISIDVGEVRHYPLGPATAHVIGYVGAVSRSEQTGDPLLRLPGFPIGKTGIEKTYDTYLRGGAGSAEVEVNVVGREVRELNRYPSQPGKPLWLTIDAELQKFAQDRLEPIISGSAVVMDVKTGAVYALASYPGFDPNIFTRGLPAATWEELLNNRAKPMTNKAIGGQYPPGSTFKMITAMALLEQGVINRHSRAFCPGHYDFGGRRFHCWKRGGHGSVNVLDALEQSCDTFFYKFTTELGIDRLSEYANKFGIGPRLGIELPEERPGLAPTRDWKRKNRGEVWHPGETVVAAIGQGYYLSTPLQLAVMTSRLVNGGYAVNPWITGYRDGAAAPGTDWPKINVSRANLDLVMQGMDLVMNGPRGTARASRIREEGMEMGGKTGTAQVRRITEEERRLGITQDKIVWHHRHHALFVGYAPLHDPRYACAVVVEHGGGGSAVAAPIARDLLIEVQKRNPAATIIRPDMDAAYPQSTRDKG